MKRRDFINAAALTIPALSFSSNHPRENKDNTETILFQGDSITDAGRNRSRYYANNLSGMGNGYVLLAASELLASHPDKDIRIYNRGISGNKVYQLAARWNEDCLQLQPNLLSILIGVNDFWHTLSSGYTGTVTKYEDDYRRLLDTTLQQVPEVKLIIGEPFFVQGGSAISDQWSSFISYQKAARNIAQAYHASFIPCQSIFDEALKKADVDHWCPDGVHPSMAGCQLMSEAWVKTINQLLV